MALFNEDFNGFEYPTSLKKSFYGHILSNSTVRNMRQGLLFVRGYEKQISNAFGATTCHFMLKMVEILRGVCLN